MNAIHDIIFSNWSIDSTEVVELQNVEHKPVGAIYLKTINPADVKISETNNSEMFYLYYKGLTIFFTYWKKINYIDY